MKILLVHGTAFVVLLFCTAHAVAGAYHSEDLRIPMSAAGPRGLEALLVRPSAQGRYPLVILSHGAPRNADDLTEMTPYGMARIAMEFARRGWTAVVVMRRGFGTSGGNYVERTRSCDDPNYVESALTSAADLKAAIKWLTQRPDVEGSRILAVGQSAGGLATVALTTAPPPGLVAAINFAGGRGSVSDYKVCREDRLVGAFQTFGKVSRIPMLWVYTENDHFFAPPLAEKFRRAFTAGGGKIDFIKPAEFGKDGHQLFSLSGISRWAPLVDSFLAKQNLTLLPSPMELDLPALRPPAQLSENGRKVFELYRMGGPHKAFAVTADGHFGWQTGRRTAADAKAQALKFCLGVAKGCQLVFIDDTPIQ